MLIALNTRDCRQVPILGGELTGALLRMGRPWHHHRSTNSSVVSVTGKVHREGGLNRQGHRQQKVINLSRIGTIPRVMSDDVMVAMDLPRVDQSEPEGTGKRGKHLASFSRHATGSEGTYCIILERRQAHIRINTNDKFRNQIKLRTHLKKITACIEVLNRPMSRVRQVSRNARDLTCRSAEGYRGKVARGVGDNRGSMFLVENNTTTSPGRGAPNKQMTPFDRLQCVQMSIHPLRVRVERAILRQRTLNSFRGQPLKK